MPAAETLSWIGNEAGHLDLIDQTRLPTELVTTSCQTVEDVWQAIKQLKVRGAPAIGIAAAYGICVAIRDLDVQTTSVDELRSKRLMILQRAEKPCCPWQNASMTMTAGCVMRSEVTERR